MTANPDAMVSEERLIEEKIAYFCAEPECYYAVTRSGRLLIVKKWVLIYPPPRDENHYAIYMGVETQEGFFLLRQDFTEKKPSPWVVEKQLFPESEEDFLLRYKNAFEQDFIINEITQNTAEREHVSHG